MHELSLCRAIADTALEHANGRPIERIRLRIGHFRQVVPDTLHFCWQMRTENTPLAGCVLDVDHIAAIIHCESCGATTELEHPVLRCGSCDSANVTMTSGEEFLIESIDVTQGQTMTETDEGIH
ncbi:MAG: hydrogenase maturation nickel metallochaperone HypA [Acidimicrobiales bacterium]